MIKLSPTFLNLFDRYVETESDDVAESLRESIISRLKGEESAPTPAMQRGLDFEKSVETFLRTGSIEHPMADMDVYEEIKSRIGDTALYQVEINAPLVPATDGLPEVTITGFIDFLNYDTIFDLKTTGRYETHNAPLNYANGYQHRAYLHALHEKGIEDFKYIIVDFSKKGGVVFVEEYMWRDSFTDDLVFAWDNLLEYLKSDEEMRLAFCEKHDVDEVFI